MFSRFDRNPLRKAACLSFLALLVTGALTVDDARAARIVEHVDGHGMAATDNTEDPRQGGGGSMEGDPWGGEQRVADDSTDGPGVRDTAPIPATGVRVALSSLWSRLLIFLSAFAR